MHDRLRAQWNARKGRNAEAAATVLDTHSARHSSQGGSRGFDASKKVKGRKRNLIVDRLGLLIAVSMTAASVQDRDVAPVAAARAMDKYPRIETLFVDGGYAGQSATALTHQLNVDVVRHPAHGRGGGWRHPDQSELFAVQADSKGFVVLPRHWVVKRTHA